MGDPEFIKPPGNTFEARATLKGFGLPGGDSIKALEMGRMQIASENFENRAFGFHILWSLATLGNSSAAKAYADAIWRYVNEYELPEAQAIHYRAIAENWSGIADDTFDLAATLSAAAEPNRRDPVQDFTAPAPEPLRLAGFTVMDGVGDPMSADGRMLSARFSPMIGKPLPRRSLTPAEGAVAEAIRLHSPWAAALGAVIEQSLSIIHQTGSHRTFNKPILLVGDKGTGKTSLAIFIARLFGRHYVRLPVGGTNDAATLAATSRGWSNCRASLPVQAMMESLSCDPCVIVDELDKASQIGSQNGSVMGALLGMLDKPHEYHDTALMTKVDLSHVHFIATANSLEPLNDALRDRFLVIPVPRPGVEHFDRILEQMRRDMSDELGLPTESLPMLDAEAYRALKSFFVEERQSLRSLRHAYEVALKATLEYQAKTIPYMM